MITQREAKEWLDHLTEVCPPPKGTRVKVVVQEIDGCDGLCEKFKNTWTITLHPQLCPSCGPETLIHEYSHVIAWRPHHPVASDHDEFWGVAYSKVRRAYHGAT